jgi:hypothetical protein
MPKRIPNRIITGCWIKEGDAVAHGDLHELDSVYIFNAVVNRSGDTNWQFGTELPPTSRVLDVTNAFTFERRAVIVAAKSLCKLSPAAKEYLGHV